MKMKQETDASGTYPALGQLWGYAIKLGIEVGYRDAEGVWQVCERNRARYARMNVEQKRAFDKTRLTLPFGDCRIYTGARGKRIRGLLATIDGGHDTALRIQELNAKGGWNIDLLFAHHAPNKWTATAPEDFCIPDARCLAACYGLPKKAMQPVESEAWELTRQGTCGMPKDFMQLHMKIMAAAEMCRQIDVAHVSVHTPCDEFAWRAVWEVLHEARPKTCQDAIEALYAIPEFRRFRQQGHQRIRMFAGSPGNPLGRWYNAMDGATLTLTRDSIKAIKDAGFNSMVGVIYQGPMTEAAREFGLNVIHLPHDAADSLGINGLLDRCLERWPKLEVLAHGSFFRVERPRCGAWTEASI
jgi:hypothetical protein